MDGGDAISRSVAGLGRKADAAIAIGNLLGEVQKFSIAVPRRDSALFDKDAVEEVGRGQDSSNLTRSKVPDTARCRQVDFPRQLRREGKIAETGMPGSRVSKSVQVVRAVISARWARFTSRAGSVVPIAFIVKLFQSFCRRIVAARCFRPGDFIKLV